MKKTPHISVIIVDYHKAKTVKKNIKHLFSQEGDFFLDIVIIDNSEDQENAHILKNIEKKHPSVKVVINQKNTGYSSANNKGSEGAKETDYIIILNPDILCIQKDSISKMLSFLQKHPEVGILGPKQINRNDNSITLSVRKFPSLFIQIARRTFLRYIPGISYLVQEDEMKNMDTTKNQDVDWVQSSCMMMKKCLWDELGGFDKDFFLFMADVEICLKCWTKRKRVVFFADTVVSADGIRCSRGGVIDFFRKKILKTHLKDALIYYKKFALKENPRNAFYDYKRNIFDEG